MSNLVHTKTQNVTLEEWINNPGIRKGILSIYANKDFDYNDNTASYELGRQIAILAKQAGLATRGSVLRKKPNSDRIAIVKTKLPILGRIVHQELMFKPKQLALTVY